MRIPVVRAVAAALLTSSVALCCPQAAASAAPGNAGLPRPAAQAAGSPVEIDVSKVTPTAAGPGDIVTITGVLRNTGDVPVEDLDFQMWSRNGRLGTRQEIADWADGTIDSDGDARGIPYRPTAPVQPGGQISFTVDVPVGAMELSDSEPFGARGLTLVVKGDNGSGLTRIASERTFVIWNPTVAEYVPTDLSLLVPLTSRTPLSNTGAGDPQTLTSMAPGGRLDHLLGSVQDKAFSWAVDPSVIDQVLRAQADQESTAQDTTSSAALASQPETARSRPAGTRAALAWLDQLRAGAADPIRSVVALPYGDPDVVALAHAGGGTLLSQAQALSQVIMTETLGSRFSGSVAWPATGHLDTATGNMLADTPGRKVVLSSSAQPPAEHLDHTPGSRTRIPTVKGGISGLVSDDGLSEEMASTGGTEPGLATQKLLADLAAVTTERPGDSRHLLASLPRGWSPDPAKVQAAMAALRSAPWVRLRSLDSLAAQPASGPVREPLVYSAGTRQAELPQEHVRSVVEEVARLDRFLPSVTDPARLLHDYHGMAFCLLSVNRRVATAQLSEARRPLEEGIDTLYGGISVPTGSSMNLLARTANLPVTIENNLGVAVRVVVALRPRSGRLVVDTPVRIEIAAHTRRQVRIPIHAVANGDVQVDTMISSPSGVVLLTAPSIMVKVHNDWEGRVLLVAGGLLGLLVVIGLVRGVRRGRVRIPASAVPDPDEEASLQDEPAVPVPAVPEHTVPEQEPGSPRGTP
ncbi:MAG: hypothetical protein QG608_983 [Actinomycetota bacterium]|nr:hypothetical protein [Actinomycetota bacterium]